MCNFNCKPIEPKDKTWWEDMGRDAQEYLENAREYSESYAQEQENE